MSHASPAQDPYPDPDVVARYVGRQLRVEEIMELLPHRPPFLLVDRISQVEPGVSAVGVKSVTINEWFFQGHFPGHPVMPGVLIIEALAQVAGVVMLTGYDRGEQVAYFTSIKEAKFREPVRPGDQLILEVEARKINRRFGRLVAWMVMRARVEDKIVAECESSFILVQPE